ncbi:hypothetical protein Bca4012_099662 [Brassica carinata]
MNVSLTYDSIPVELGSTKSSLSLLYLIALYLMAFMLYSSLSMAFLSVSPHPSQLAPLSLPSPSLNSPQLLFLSLNSHCFLIGPITTGRLLPINLSLLDPTLSSTMKLLVLPSIELQLTRKLFKFPVRSDTVSWDPCQSLNYSLSQVSSVESSPSQLFDLYFLEGSRRACSIIITYLRI